MRERDGGAAVNRQRVTDLANIAVFPNTAEPHDKIRTAHAFGVEGVKSRLAKEAVFKRIFFCFFCFKLCIETSNPIGFLLYFCIPRRCTIGD